MKYLFCFLTLLLLCSCGKQKEVTYEVGYRGKARINPYLAAKRLLEVDHKVTSQPGWTSYEEETSFVVIPVSALPIEATGRRMLQWVDDGGHLVCVLEAGEGIHSDWGWSFQDVFRKDIEDYEGFTHILEQLNVELTDVDKLKLVADKKKAKTPAPSSGTPASSSTPTTSKKTIPDNNLEYYEQWPRPSDSKPEETKIQLGNDLLTIGMKGPLRLLYDQELNDNEYANELSEDEEAYKVLSLTYGEYGRVTLLIHARPLRNAFIGNLDNAEFVQQLSDLAYEGDSVLVYAGGSSFMQMLRKYGWRILLAVAFFLILWLMRNMARFGPMAAVRDDTKQEYTHHLGASGSFLWLNKRSDVLLDHLRREVMAKFEHNQHGKTEIERESLFESIATQLNLPIERVIEAFSRKEVKDSSAMTRIISDLKRIKNTL